MLLTFETCSAIATIAGVHRFSAITVVIGFLALAMTCAMKYRENGEQMRALAKSPRAVSDRPSAAMAYRLAA
jgi:hypothetical protein